MATLLPHLVKKTLSSLIYFTRLLYVVTGNGGVFLELFSTALYWQAGYSVLGAAAPFFFNHSLVPKLLCSCDVALLIVTGIFRQYFVSQVQKIRLQGYYSFSQKLKHIVRLPFAITAYGIAAMLLVVVWRPQITFLSISALLRIIMLTEVICAVSFMSVYIGAMIIIGRVDLAHMLAAREQESRTLSAETNQLQTELRLARSLIAERDSEVQRVRATNNQYVEENERLRAILGEWSTRAAKLEQALEVERMSNFELHRKFSTSRNQTNISTEQSEQHTAQFP